MMWYLKSHIHVKHSWGLVKKKYVIEESEKRDLVDTSTDSIAVEDLVIALEANEAYMLKELTHLMYKENVIKLVFEDAIKLVFEDANTHVIKLKQNVVVLEENCTIEREKIQHDLKTLEELEGVYNKHLKTQEDLDNEMRICKDEFKKFERKDVKYQEGHNPLKQKIKKVDDKLKKDSSKIDEIKKNNEDKLLEEIIESSKVKGKLKVALSENKLLKEKHAADRTSYEEAQ